MLIVCPNCSASYRVASGDLGRNGRSVRCTACKTVWHVGPQDVDEVSAAEAAEHDWQEPATHEQSEEDDWAAALAAEDAQDEPVSDSTGPIGNGFSEEDFAPVGTGAPAPEDIETAAKRWPAFRARRRERRFGAQQRPWPKPRLAAVVLGMAVALLAAGLIWRERAVALAPDLASLYAALGFDVNLRGLEFRELVTSETLDNGVPLLVVSGSIENVTDWPVTVPRLRLAVRGPGGREIYVWTAVPSRARLSPGESLPFWAQLASPPPEGREVAVRFLNQRDAALGLGRAGI